MRPSFSAFAARTICAQPPYARSHSARSRSRQPTSDVSVACPPRFPATLSAGPTGKLRTGSRPVRWRDGRVRPVLRGHLLLPCSTRCRPLLCPHGSPFANRIRLRGAHSWILPVLPDLPIGWRERDKRLVFDTGAAGAVEWRLIRMCDFVVKFLSCIAGNRHAHGGSA